jgi:hypothetical protein
VITTDPVIVAMASIPERKETLLKVVASLHRQCDRICLYLNNYPSVPPELAAYSSVTTLLAGPGRMEPDRRDVGKFYWVEQFSPCYYMTVDDDIDYPSDYVPVMINAVEEYNREAIISVHGVFMHLYKDKPHELPDCSRHRAIVAFEKHLNVDLAVHVAGTGTTAFHTGKIPVSKRDIMNPPGDGDAQLAVYAQRTQTPIIIIKRAASWLKSFGRAANTKPMCRNVDILRRANSWYYSVGRWNLYYPKNRVTGDAPYEDRGINV